MVPKWCRPVNRLTACPPTSNVELPYSSRTLRIFFNVNCFSAGVGLRASS